jgi:sulfatase modifying factor 1
MKHTSRIITIMALTLFIAVRSFAVDADNKKLVLCWYMVCFGNSVEGYKQEMELAQRNGIDGFLLDVGAWDGNYIISADRMYEAAKQLNTGFKLAMTPEYSVQPFTPKVCDMVMKYRDHPNQLKHDGKVVLSGYCNAAMFAPVVEKLKADGVNVFLIPDIFLPRYQYNPSVETYYTELANNPYLDGVMMFCAEQLGSTIWKNAIARRATLKKDKLLGACVMPAYNSANLQDYRGMSGYMSMWEGAINDGADWISIVIWNDYNEDSGLMPNRWPNGSERYLYDRDESFLYATAYSSAWFKSGVKPTITQDKIFVTYRTRSKWERKGWDGKKWVDICLSKTWPYDQIHDDVQDLVYIDTFLTASADVTVYIGKQKNSIKMNAGVGHAEVPMTPGVPRVVLERNKKVLADVLGRKLIIDTPTEKNSLLGYHHVNRTWISGTAVGPVVKHLEAESGKVENGATVVEQNKVKAVKIEQKKGSGFSLPVDGLATGTYNVRITYSNPSKEEARLTMYSNGPVRAANEYPYFIPAYLPPTEKGKFQTVSFFWSLYDTTKNMKIQWQPGAMWGKADPNDNDYGDVMIDAIDLIKVDPVVMPEKEDISIPQMVSIPAGSFTMGSKKGEPDELPLNNVTLSAFAIGKYEVTNEEFERFDPTHRAFRNGNSWRDKEPVLHLSWGDAAKYCNWLSKQNNLTPVYDEKTLMADLKADGYRLPTEAEWEYVATGRGESRAYPWGNTAPVPGVHGQFKGAAALGARLPRPATEEAGVVVRGSFPAGASRDGVMDMAGNVGEWCTDWYDYYSADAKTDPCQQTAGNYRVIRGGSWSWYGYSQRASDREFNSPNYPGHAYYGFRLAISDAGWKKMVNGK